MQYVDIFHDSISVLRETSKTISLCLIIQRTVEWPQGESEGYVSLLFCICPCNGPGHGVDRPSLSSAALHPPLPAELPVHEQLCLASFTAAVIL